MNIRTLYAAILAVLLAVWACSEEVIEIPQKEQEESASVISGLLSIKFSEEMAAQIASSDLSGMPLTKSSDVNAFFSELGVTSARRIFTEDERFLERQHREGLHLWYELCYDPSRMPATKAAEGLSCFDGIEIAEPVRRIQSGAVNDPYAGNQWHLYQSSGVDLNVQGVWDNYTCGSPEIIVSVVDSGIDIEHEDLGYNAIPGGNGKSYNFCTNSYKINPMSHGSHVAGIIAATRNNGLGIAGIAGGDYKKGLPGVKLLSCQVFDLNSEGKEYGVNSADAIRYGADNGAVISQNSWGYVFDDDGNGVIDSNELEDMKNYTLPSSMKAAIDYFIKYAGCDNDGNQLPNSPMKGGVVIFAAGNDNVAYGWPAMYEEVISVGALASDGSKASYSNYGDWVDISAPGSAIYSTVPGGYANMQGTSMACPMVSGVAALVLSYRGGFGFTNEDLKACLLNGASYSKISTRTIGPMVDALNAVSYGLETAPAPVSEIRLEAVSNNINIDFTVPDKGDGNAAYGVIVYASKNKTSIEALDPRRPGSDIKTVNLVTYDKAVGGSVNTRISELAFETDYYITAVAYNAGPVYSDPCEILGITTGINNPPVVSCDTPSEELRLKTGESVNVLLSVNDPDGHQFSFDYVPGSSAETPMKMDGGMKITINGSKADAGQYCGKLTATDKYGLSTSFELNYTILENQAPQISSEIENVLMFSGDATYEIDLSSYFVDPDGDMLTYNAESGNPGVVAASTSGKILYLTPLKNGLCDISVSALDPRKAVATQSFRIAVRQKGQTVTAYPTQVQGNLYIATGEDDMQTSVKIVSASSGAILLKDEGTSSAFAPMVLDLSNLSPGRYYADINYGSESSTIAFVKL